VNINPTTTVREVALEMPEATRIFERLKIDYCCGGQKPLSEACAAAGVELGNVMQLLEAASQTETGEAAALDFQRCSLTELINHILDKHHVFTVAEMARLETLTDKVISAHGENHPELRQIGSLFGQLCSDLKPHIFKEEQILFPYIIAMDESANQNRTAPIPPFGTVNNPIRMMMMEHDAAGGILRQLRAASSDYAVPPDGCASYQAFYQGLEAFEQDLHQHIHLENNILFPRAIELEASF
jgi:regulator of cell morphogenesis and NO signaling